MGKVTSNSTKILNLQFFGVKNAKKPVLPDDVTFHLFGQTTSGSSPKFWRFGKNMSVQNAQKLGKIVQYRRVVAPLPQKAKMNVFLKKNILHTVARSRFHWGHSIRKKIEIKC